MMQVGMISRATGLALLFGCAQLDRRQALPAAENGPPPSAHAGETVLFADTMEGPLDPARWTSPAGYQRLQFVPGAGVGNTSALRFSTQGRANRDAAIFHATYGDPQYRQARDPMTGKTRFAVQVDMKYLPDADLRGGVVVKSSITELKSSKNGTRVYFNGYAFVASPKEKTKLPHNVWLIRLGQRNCEECREERWLVGGDADVRSERWVRLRLEVDGSTFDGYVDDKLVLSYTDGSNYADGQTMVGLLGRRNKDEDPAHALFTTADFERLYEDGKLLGDHYVSSHRHDYLFDNFIITEHAAPQR